MKRYFSIYKAFFKANLAELFTYKANLINNILSSVIWGGVSVILMLFLTAKTPMVFGWTRNEILLLTGVGNIFVSIFYFLFSRNFDRFSPIIHTGQLDAILLKPVDSQFLMSLQYVNFSGLFRIVIGIGFTVWVLNQMNYVPSISSLILFIIMFIGGILTMYALWYIVSTLLIWWTNLSNLSGLLYEFNSFMRFPQQMYKSLGFILFYVVFPLTLIINIPTLSLIGKSNLMNTLLVFLFAFIFFSASRLFWKFALRFYTSASG